MKESLISIIVPVFNAERFLPQCIESILCQSYVNWEMIAVDDGSTDKSLEILNAYSAKDPRIHIISKGNEGVSIARNVALSQAKGDYVYFVDADDEVMPNALKILLEEMENTQATFVKSDFLPVDETGRQIFVNKRQVIRRKYDGKILDSENFFRKILMKEYFLWTCLFRRDIIEANHIQFIPHCRLMEDSAFIAGYLQYSERNVYKDACVYRYRKYENTASVAKKDYSKDLEMLMMHFEGSEPSAIRNILYNNVKQVWRDLKGTAFQKKENEVYRFFSRIMFTMKYLTANYILK